VQSRVQPETDFSSSEKSDGGRNQLSDNSAIRLSIFLNLPHDPRYLSDNSC
jgi:hypothetical protein